VWGLILMAVDHDTFISADFFRPLVLTQVQTAIEELAAGEKS